MMDYRLFVNKSIVINYYGFMVLRHLSKLMMMVSGGNGAGRPIFMLDIVFPFLVYIQ